MNTLEFRKLARKLAPSRVGLFTNKMPAGGQRRMALWLYPGTDADKIAKAFRRAGAWDVKVTRPETGTMGYRFGTYVRATVRYDG